MREAEKATVDNVSDDRWKSGLNDNESSPVNKYSPDFLQGILRPVEMGKNARKNGNVEEVVGPGKCVFSIPRLQFNLCFRHGKLPAGHLQNIGRQVCPVQVLCTGLSKMRKETAGCTSDIQNTQ